MHYYNDDNGIERCCMHTLTVSFTVVGMSERSCEEYKQKNDVFELKTVSF